MKTLIVMMFLLILFVGGIYTFGAKNKSERIQTSNSSVQPSIYWFMLHRKSEIEYFYHGIPGNVQKSTLLKTFSVKSGQAGKKPTPLPELVGREYWIINDKFDASDNPETAPYFLAFDIESGAEYPYGPSPYLECDGQCDWEVPGYFGLHGVAGNSDKLTDADPGSSGCVRHSDEDITYLYNLLDPQNEEIRYYIKHI